MLLSVLSKNRESGYQAAVSNARHTLIPVVGNIDDCIEPAMHAMNACRLYIKKGKIRQSQMPDGRPVIQIVTRSNVVVSPAIQQLLMWVTADSAMAFLQSAAGISVLCNTSENPF
jgi:hypothetical protein